MTFVLICSPVCAAGPEIIYRKALPDGGIVTVEKTTRQEYVPEKKGKYVYASGYKQIDSYTMRLSLAESGAAIIWSKIITFFEQDDPAGVGTTRATFSMDMVVHDVVRKGARTAILYSSNGIYIEVVQTDSDGKQTVELEQKLFKGTASGGLVWLDDLYVLWSTPSGNTQVWRVQGASAEVVLSLKNDGNPRP